MSLEDVILSAISQNPDEVRRATTLLGDLYRDSDTVFEATSLIRGALDLNMQFLAASVMKNCVKYIKPDDPRLMDFFDEVFAIGKDLSDVNVKSQAVEALTILFKFSPKIVVQRLGDLLELYDSDVLIPVVLAFVGFLDPATSEEIMERYYNQFMEILSNEDPVFVVTISYLLLNLIDVNHSIAADIIQFAIQFDQFSLFDTKIKQKILCHFFKKIGATVSVSHLDVEDTQLYINRMVGHLDEVGIDSIQSAIVKAIVAPEIKKDGTIFTSQIIHFLVKRLMDNSNEPKGKVATLRGLLHLADFVPVDMDLLQCLISIAIPTPEDLVDFYVNPLAFYHLFFSVANECRDDCHPLVVLLLSCFISRSEEFASFLLQLPRHETVIRIVALCCKGFEQYRALRDQLFEWLAEQLSHPPQTKMENAALLLCVTSYANALPRKLIEVTMNLIVLDSKEELLSWVSCKFIQRTASLIASTELAEALAPLLLIPNNKRVMKALTSVFANTTCPELEGELCGHILRYLFKEDDIDARWLILLSRLLQHTSNEGLVLTSIAVLERFCFTDFYDVINHVLCICIQKSQKAALHGLVLAIRIVSMNTLNELNDFLFSILMAITKVKSFTSMSELIGTFGVRLLNALRLSELESIHYAAGDILSWLAQRGLFAEFYEDAIDIIQQSEPGDVCYFAGVEIAMSIALGSVIPPTNDVVNGAVLLAKQGLCLRKCDKALFTLFFKRTFTEISPVIGEALAAIGESPDEDMSLQAGLYYLMDDYDFPSPLEMNYFPQ